MTEFQFIESIEKLARTLPANGFEGIGDDCAILGTGQGDALVFTTDLLTEDIHFLTAAATPREIGRKSLAVNLSDVAAMGAAPAATLLGLSLPAEAIASGWAEAFMQGYTELSARYGVLLAGGDTTASAGKITVSVTAIGRAPTGHLKRRSAALPGDVILVAGPLGESAAGLRDILSGHYDTPLARIHKNPLPQVEEGIWLGGRSEVHAMMDLSDGLASDLRHIAERSGTGAEIDIERIPTPVDLQDALCGGEDYKLLLTADPAACAELTAAFSARFGTPLYPVGRVVEPAKKGVVRWLRNGEPLPDRWQGFSHF